MDTKPLDLHQYFPFFLGTIANKWASSSSRIYLSEFGIGISAWRVLASIQSLEEATSLDVVNLISMDAGAVSRAVTQLEQEGYIQRKEGRFPGRTKPFVMTDAGRKLHRKIMTIALEREALLLAGLNEHEKKDLIKIMRKILARLDQL